MWNKDYRISTAISDWLWTWSANEERGLCVCLGYWRAGVIQCKHCNYIYNCCRYPRCPIGPHDTHRQRQEWLSAVNGCELSLVSQHGKKRRRRWGRAPAASRPKVFPVCGACAVESFNENTNIKNRTGHNDGVIPLQFGALKTPSSIQQTLFVNLRFLWNWSW